MFAFFGTIVGLLTVYYIPAILIYLVVGVGYAALKWVFKNVKLRRKVLQITEEQVKRRFARDQKSYNYKNEVDARDDLRKYEASQIFGKYEYPPQVKNNRGWLMFWSLAWPLNLPWTLFHDVASEAFSWVWYKTGGLLQKLSNSILPN